MNLRSRPFLMAVAWGAALQVVYQLFTLALTFMLVYPALEQTLSGGAVDPIPAPTVLLNSSTFISIGGWFLGMLLHAAVGFSYAYFHRRQAPVTPDQGAVGGAAASAAARLLSGFLGLLLSSAAMYAFTSGTPFFTEAAGGMPPEALVVSVFASAFGGLIGLCFGAAFAALIGALGGGLGALLLNR